MQSSLSLALDSVVWLITRRDSHYQFSIQLINYHSFSIILTATQWHLATLLEYKMHDENWKQGVCSKYCFEVKKINAYCTQPAKLLNYNFSFSFGMKV